MASHKDSADEIDRDLVDRISSRCGAGELGRDDQLALRYSSLTEEYSALRQGVGLGFRPWHSWLRLTGKDRVRFVHGLVTCDVKGLEPGSGAYGYFTAAKGQVLSDALILATAAELWIRLPNSRVEAIRSHLERYVITDQVEVEVAADLGELVLGALSFARLLSPDRVPVSPWGHHLETVLGRTVRVFSDVLWGGAAVALLGRQSDFAEITKEITDGKDSSETPFIGFEAQEAARIAAGIPAWGVDFGEGNLPQEVGIPGALNLEKGCYLGQEVVARIHFRGKVRRLLRQVKFAEGVRPAAGAEVVFEERPAGRLTSWAPVPEEGSGSIGLSILQARAAERGTRVMLDSVEAVIEIPPTPDVSLAGGKS